MMMEYYGALYALLIPPSLILRTVIQDRYGRAPLHRQEWVKGLNEVPNSTHLEDMCLELTPVLFLLQDCPVGKSKCKASLKQYQEREEEAMGNY